MSEVMPLPTPDEPEPVSADQVVRAFAESMASADVDTVAELLADDVVVRVSGRSVVAGDHHGRAAAMTALVAAPASGVSVTASTVTEVLVDGDRGIVVIELEGWLPEPADGADRSAFRFEVAFHLVVTDGFVVGVTEYSADQYIADRLLAAEPDQSAAEGRGRRWPWSRG